MAGDGRIGEILGKLKGIKERLTPEKLVTGILVGALLLVIAMPTGTKPDKEEAGEKGQDNARQQVAGLSETASDAAYVADLEERLSAMLGKVSGIGKVEVMITLSTTSEEILNKDIPYRRESVTDSDEAAVKQQNSYESEEKTVLVEKGGDSLPYVIKSVYPEIEGVLVVAQGADQAAIKNEIIEATQVLFGVEAHKVKVLGMD